MTLSQIYSSIINKADLFLESKNWKYKIVLSSILLFLVSQFIFAPSSFLAIIHFFKSYIIIGEEYGTFKIINERTNDLFSVFKVNNFDSFSHEHKLIYRLFLPILAKLSPIKYVGVFIYFSQIIVGVLYIYLVTNFVYKITDHKTITFFFVLTFTSIYAGNAFIWDVTGYGDFWAYFFLFLCIYRYNSFSIILFLTLAFWVDERAVVNSVFVYCWWIITNNLKLNQDKFINFKFLFPIIIAIIGYFLGRFLLNKYFSLPSDSKYLKEFVSTIYENIKYQGFRFWTAFEGFTGLIILALTCLFKTKNYKSLLLLILSSIVTIGVAFFAHDGNRGFSYSVVFLFICLFITTHFFTKKESLYLIISVFIISFLFPMANRLRFPGGFTIM